VPKINYKGMATESMVSKAEITANALIYLVSDPDGENEVDGVTTHQDFGERIIELYGGGGAGHEHTNFDTLEAIPSLTGVTAGYYLAKGEGDTIVWVAPNWALSNHNHDGVYSPVGHNHDGVYSPVGHLHTGVYQPADSDLTALAGLGSTGLIARIAAGTVTTRSIAVSGNGLNAVSNGDGVSGNPTISLNIGTGSTQVAAGNHAHGALSSDVDRAGFAFYDGVPTSNLSFTGMDQVTGVECGEALQPTDRCYYNASGVMKKADADALSTALGFYWCGGSYASGASGTFYYGEGWIKNTAWNWSTKGAPLFGSTTPGAITDVAPSGSGDIVMGVGHVWDADTIRAKDFAWVERT